jgi:hypothetical protein
MIRIKNALDELGPEPDPVQVSALCLVSIADSLEKIAAQPTNIYSPIYAAKSPDALVPKKQEKNEWQTWHGMSGRPCHIRHSSTVRVQFDDGRIETHVLASPEINWRYVIAYQIINQG